MSLITEKCPSLEKAEYDAALPASVPKQRTRPTILTPLIYSLITCLVLASICACLPSKTTSAAEMVHSLTKYAVVVAPALLQDFQVYPPVLTPLSKGLDSMTVEGKRGSCVVQQTLMEHSFASSYNVPFVGQYTPPTCKFNRITFNLTAVSAGRQFDRLGAVYFGNTEIWRTTTAEPSQTGIEWVYVKDMSNYLALFKEPQKLIFDLGNLINSVYTAPYNVTLTATFFTSEDTVDPADMIVPVSPRNASEDMASVFQYPMMHAINTFKLPQNIRKAVFTMSATGQINEEFWFGNALTSDVDTFGQNSLLPYSPFREVQLYIDGMLAGVAWPFPIIFTGGVVPGLWRPIVGIDAFDLKEDEIDITPWLPLICDGKEHSFEIQVAGINDNGLGQGELTPNIGNYWLLTGKVFIWLDPSGSATTGSKIQRHVQKPSIQLSSETTKTPKGQNKTLVYSVDVQRNLFIKSTINTAKGSSQAYWSQSLVYSNAGNFTQFGNKQVTKQSTNGTDVSSSGYSRKISYPIKVSETFAENPKTKAFSIDATIHRGQDIQIAGAAVFPTGLQSFNSGRKSKKAPGFQGSKLRTSQNGTAHYASNAANNITSSSGSTQQEMTFTGFSVSGRNGHRFPAQHGSKELYTRRVVAVNATVVDDKETLEGRPYRSYSRPRSSVKNTSGGFAGGSVRKLLGHGPPKHD